MWLITRWDKMKLCLGVALFSSLFIAFCDASNILVVFNMHSYSHHILGKLLAEELALKGHQVTIMSENKNNDSIPNLKSVYLSGLQEAFRAQFGNNDGLTPEEFLNMPASVLYFMISNFCLIGNEFTFSHKNVQQHLKENHKYDVVIVEHFFSDSLKAFCYHYKAPCIAFSTVGSNPSINYLVGNPASPSFIPDFFLGASGEMSLFERTQNLVYQTFTTLSRELYFMPQHQAQVQKFFPGAPHIYDILADTSLVFLNSHFSLTQPVPHVPNMIEVGGMHINPSNSPLPDDIKKFLDGAKDGAVYFSFGSNLKSKDLSVEKKQALIKTFEQLKLKVLWKFEEHGLLDLPKNVKISSWLPQQDVLAHPNVKVFITHGGLLSLTEAMHFGVPVIGIPFFGDQRINMAEVERIGIGIKIYYPDFNEITLTKALTKITTDKSYSENMKKRSAIMRDRPMTPMETAIYWVEYLIRHKGGLHMKSTSLSLSWYQYYMIDAILLIVIIASIPLFAMCWIFKKLLKKLCSKKADSEKKRK